VDLITANAAGLYCPAGDFYIDPWRPVERAIITHGHSDHARPGHGVYLCHKDSAPILRHRLGDIRIESLDYGETLDRDGVKVSLHPAGHVLGSAQIRLEHGGAVWVASGDYKLEADGTCEAFTPLTCDAFITESTFGLPIYKWRPQQEIADDINRWWRANAEQGQASVIGAYPLGKAQRILRHLDPSIGPIVCHGAVEPLNEIYRASGAPLPHTIMTRDGLDKKTVSRALVLAPPSALSSPWMRRFGDYSDAFASGWMQIRGNRRRRGVDQGFVLSDHADWPSLMQAIEATGAKRVLVTHGGVAPLVRFLDEKGYDAAPILAEFGDEVLEREEAKDEPPEPAPGGAS
jgi:putative mRNA 3-end processing factor